MLGKNDEQIRWFESARLGMFIHWGIYSATEGIYNGKETEGIVEWIQAREEIPTSEYEKFTENLSADNFDAEKIACLAKDAGMKYIVFTAKHHEGFAMYDTAWGDYSITKRCGAKIDPVKEITSAARSKGIMPCIYYSHAIDFHEENAMGNTWDFKTPEDERDFKDYLDGKAKFQIKELLTNYGDIGMMWFDVPRGITEEIAADLRSFVKGIQSSCLINGRLTYFSGYHDYICMGDNETPSARPKFCAETCASTNDTWGYKRNDKNFKRPESIIKLLCALVSKGVNLLLNIGPKPDGSVPEECISILKELSRWMKINSEAVYETKASPFEADFSFGWVSQKENNLYLYIDKPQETINIFGLKNKILSAKTMSGESVDFCVKNGNVSFNLNNIEFDSAVTVLKLQLDTVPQVSEKLFQQENGYIMLPACSCTVSEIEGNDKTGSAFNVDSKIGEAQMILSQMRVNLNGIVSNWRSEKNYISWDFEVNSPGEYEAIVYTVTSKYQPWKGEHRVSVVLDDNRISKALSEDVIPEGVNRKYFAETGSIIGTINFDKAGTHNLKLLADKINPEDNAGLAVTRMILIKK